jgi:hypothetical protein
VLAGLNSLEAAEQDAIEAAELRNEINDRGQLAQTYRLLSSIYRGLGRLSDAEQYSDLAAITAARGQDPVAEGQSLLALVSANLLMGADAKNHLTKAIEYFLPTKAYRQLTEAYLLMAQVLQMERDFEAAAGWVRHAQAAAEHVSDAGLLGQVAFAQALLDRNRALKRNDEGRA